MIFYRRIFSVKGYEKCEIISMKMLCIEYNMLYTHCYFMIFQQYWYKYIFINIFREQNILYSFILN